MGRAARGIAPLGGRRGLGPAERTRVAVAAPRGQIEVELGPLRARDRPLALVAEMICAVTGADGELHRRVLHHFVVDVLDPGRGESQLVASAVAPCERRTMCD